MAQHAEELAAGIRDILGGSPLPPPRPARPGEPLVDTEPEVPPVVQATPETPEAVERDLATARNQCYVWRSATHTMATQLARLTSGEEAIRERRVVEYLLENFVHSARRWLDSEDQRDRLWELYQELPIARDEEGAAGSGVALTGG